MTILLLAGEESGVIYAERLRSALLAERADIEFRGYGTEGFRTADLAVMGFIPVLRKIFYFLRVARTMKRVIDEWHPDAVVTIDYPGLNLKLAAYAKSKGIPAIHLVCPQVWAWHKNRIPKVADALTKLLCFFPFEPALFAGTGLDAKFIGHPMVDVFAQEKAAEANVGENCNIHDTRLVAVLPGSRAGEIAHNLPRLIEAVAILNQEFQESFRVVIPAANDKAFLAICAEVQKVPGLPIEVVRGGARDLLRRADCAAVASGTATLEAALARCPTVLVYAVSPLLAWFARRVITGVHYIGLANVIWEKSVAGTSAPVAGEGSESAPMPELLQEAFTPKAVAEQLGAWLKDESARKQAIARLDAAMALLHSDGDALGIAAREILKGCRIGSR